RQRARVPRRVGDAADAVVLSCRRGLRAPQGRACGQACSRAIMATHAERRPLPYSPEQLFDLVAAIHPYPEFLPWGVAARIRGGQANVLIGDLVIGFKMIRERFTSKVTLDRPKRIDVQYLSGPMQYLNNHWTFTAVPSSPELPGGGTMIDFYVDFEF